MNGSFGDPENTQNLVSKPELCDVLNNRERLWEKLQSFDFESVDEYYLAQTQYNVLVKILHNRQIIQQH